MERWDRQGLPHKGWEWIDVIDLREDADSTYYEKCEMCGKEKIRYAHIMRHPNYPEEIHVGCVCAEKMTGDYINHRKAENSLKNKFQRKKNFYKTQWKYNPEKKSYTKRYKGDRITIVESRYGNWGIFYLNMKVWKDNGKKIMTFEDAQEAAFKIFDENHTS